MIINKIGPLLDSNGKHLINDRYLSARNTTPKLKLRAQGPSDFATSADPHPEPAEGLPQRLSPALPDHDDPVQPEAGATRRGDKI